MLCVDKLCPIDGGCISTGDFNLPDIDWVNMTSPEGAKSKQFLDFCLSHGFNQFVTVPTRQDNILDLVLCNERMLISDIEVGMPFGLSDHDSITFTVATEKPTTKKEPKLERALDWTCANWSAFSNYCRSADWDEAIDERLSVDELWGVLTTVLKTGIKKFIPYRKGQGNSVKPRQRHQNKHIKKQKAKKLKLWRKLKKSNSTKYKKRYRKAAKRLKTVTAIEHQRTELKIINSNDLGSFYKHVNKNSVHRTGIGPLKAPSGHLVLDDKEKAKILNDYFVSICTTDDGVLPPLPDPASCSASLDSITFRTTQVFRILKR